MELWQSLLVAFGGNAALLLVLGFFGRSLAIHWLDRDVARLRSELERSATEHRVRFTKLHEQRATIIAALYERLALANRCAHRVVVYAPGPDPRRDDYWGEAKDAFVDFHHYLDDHQIWLPESICVMARKFVVTLNLKLGIMVGGQMQSGPEGNEATKRDWEDAMKAMREEIPQLRGALEAEFRTLLYEAARGPATSRVSA